MRVRLLFVQTSTRQLESTLEFSVCDYDVPEWARTPLRGLEAHRLDGEDRNAFQPWMWICVARSVAGAQELSMTLGSGCGEVGLDESQAGLGGLYPWIGVGIK